MSALTTIATGCSHKPRSPNHLRRRELNAGIKPGRKGRSWWPLADQLRTSLVPFGSLFVGVRKCDHRRLRKMSAADLKTDWQTGRGEAAWNRDRGQPVYIKRCRID